MIQLKHVDLPREYLEIALDAGDARLDMAAMIADHLTAEGMYARTNFDSEVKNWLKHGRARIQSAKRSRTQKRFWTHIDDANWYGEQIEAANAGRSQYVR